MYKIINDNLTAHLTEIKVAIEANYPIIYFAAVEIKKCLDKGGKLLIAGNGGSAADAQHMAAEMVGRLLKDRAPMAAVALTTDSSILTALGNDYGYENIFSRQLEALASPNDVVLLISTSGNSPNIIRAAEVALDKCSIVTLCGGGELSDMGDFNIITKGSNSGRIQEIHIFVLHTLAQLVENM